LGAFFHGNGVEKNTLMQFDGMNRIADENHLNRIGKTIGLDLKIPISIGDGADLECAVVNTGIGDGILCDGIYNPAFDFDSALAVERHHLEEKEKKEDNELIHLINIPSRGI